MGDRGPVHEGRLLRIVEDEKPGAVTVEMIEESRPSRGFFWKNPPGAGEAAKNADFDAEPDVRAINVIVWIGRRQWGLSDRDRRFRDQNAFIVAWRQHEVRVRIVEKLRRTLGRQPEA